MYIHTYIHMLYMCMYAYLYIYICMYILKGDPFTQRSRESSIHDFIIRGAICVEAAGISGSVHRLGRPKPPQGFPSMRNWTSRDAF